MQNNFSRLSGIHRSALGQDDMAFTDTQPSQASNGHAAVRVAIELDGHLVTLSFDDGDYSAEIKITPRDARQLGQALIDASAVARMAASTSVQ